MSETIPQTSQDTIKEVTELFNLDPSNNNATINAIAYLYEENRKLNETNKDLQFCIKQIVRGERYMIRYTNEDSVQDRLQKVEERLMEVARWVPAWLCETEDPSIRRNSLADKWK